MPSDDPLTVHSVGGRTPSVTLRGSQDAVRNVAAATPYGSAVRVVAVEEIDALRAKLAAVEAVCDRMESAAWRDRWDSIGLPDQPEHVSSTGCIMTEVADGVNRAGAMLRAVLDAG